MPYTMQQARAYYNTLSAEEKARIDALGGPTVEWLTAAVNAGVPDAGRAVGGREGGIDESTGQRTEIEGGTRVDTGGNTADWKGIRNPTPSELRAYAREQGWSEDFERFSDRQMAAWINESWDQSSNMFQGGVEKPTERGGSSAPRGGGGRGGGRGTYGGAPAFNYQTFQAPSYSDAMADPGYQFSLREGADLLRSYQSASGSFRDSGSLKGLMAYGQDRARQQYGEVYGRAAQTHGINYQTAKDKFAPRYGSWQTQYSGNLQKYLQRENNIYGLLNQPPPTYPGAY